MLRIHNIKISLQHAFNDVKQQVAFLLGIETSEIQDIKISGKSIDARKKSDIVYIYSVDISINGEDRFLGLPNVKKVEHYKYKIDKITSGKRPIVIGSGPGGLFAALILSQAGLKPLVIERGKSVEGRICDVENFFEKGILNPESNVQFGEGGAGTFSDGKLTTNLHDPRINKIIQELINAGAPEEIGYISKPHIGTDNLIGILANIRKKIENLGGEYLFEHKLISITCENEQLKSITIESKEKTFEITTDYVILAIGHSARDTVKMLYKNGVILESKPFSIGLRIEHKREFINKSQYGNFADYLPAADYKLNMLSQSGRGVYTFCMCPGGVVVPASSESNQLVVNGMSNYKRDCENSNSAVLVNIHKKDFDEAVPLAGLYFQEELERKAFALGGGDYKAPIQLVGDFLKNSISKKLGDIKPTYSIGYKFANLSEIFPTFITDSLREGLIDFDKKIKGFIKYDAILTAVESRSSSPVRILRNENMSSNINGIIPCAEGAGYAGGIMSAAVDGIKCAEKLCEQIK